jgi:hypothetical protein
MLSLEVCVVLIEHVFCEGQYTTEVKTRFSEQFLNSAVPHWNVVQPLMSKFHETGSENNPRTLDELRTSVIQFTQSVTQEDLVKVLAIKLSTLMHTKKEEAVICSTTYSDTHFMQSVCTTLCGMWLIAVTF